MSMKVNNSAGKIYVKHFAGAKTTFIKDYMHPSLIYEPNHAILHVGTNDVDSEPKVLRIP